MHEQVSLVHRPSTEVHLSGALDPPVGIGVGVDGIGVDVDGDGGGGELLIIVGRCRSTGSSDAPPPDGPCPQLPSMQSASKIVKSC
jgi:hypothetical protein